MVQKILGSRTDHHQRRLGRRRARDCRAVGLARCRRAAARRGCRHLSAAGFIRGRRFHAVQCGDRSADRSENGRRHGQGLYRRHRSPSAPAGISALGKSSGPPTPAAARECLRGAERRRGPTRGKRHAGRRKCHCLPTGWNGAHLDPVPVLEPNRPEHGTDRTICSRTVGRRDRLDRVSALPRQEENNMQNVRESVSLSLCAAAVIGALPAAHAALAEPSAGEAVYTANCASCHGTTLGGTFGPPLTGENFQRKWAERGAAAMLNLVRATMPPAKPGGLTRDAYAETTEYILAKNGLPPLDKTSETTQRPPPVSSEGGADSGGAGNASENEDAQFRAA